MLSIRSLKRTAKRSGGYLVAEFPDQQLAESVVNPKRGASLSVPLADWKQQTGLQREMFEAYKLDDYADCTTVEMAIRPVPHVFETERVQKLSDLYAKWLPAILSKLMPAIKAPTQPLNKTSRMGYPFFGRPLSKATVVRGIARQVERGDMDALDDAFIIMNVRLQPEPASKLRSFLFVDETGNVFEKEIDRRQMKVEVGEVGMRVPARTRLVFNPPAHNLVAQVLDTALHNAMLEYPFCHHNMYDKSVGFSYAGSIFCFDVKHFERSTAPCVAIRSDVIGGRYGEINARFRDLPFLVPSTKRAVKQLLWPDREGGWTEQFGSGISSVSPVQKEIFLALYAEFGVTGLGISPDSVLEWVMNGGDNRIRILNYGDDNATFGEPSVQKQLFAFLSEYLPVEEEDPAKFLGFLWTPQGWRLGVNSYLLKTYLNERAPGSAFRKFPCYGWMLKREVYRDYGVPEIASRIFMAEDMALRRWGIGWEKIVHEAAAERARSQAWAALQNKNWLMGKDWLMTAEEKVATGLFDGFGPSETGPMLRYLLGTDWLRKTRL